MILLLPRIQPRIFSLMVSIRNISLEGYQPLNYAISSETVCKPTEATANSPSMAASPTPSAVKDVLGVTLRFTQTLMKKLPDIVDGNPVKMALSLAKTIIQIKDVRALIYLIIVW
jgi:hypothetical protein